MKWGFAESIAFAAIMTLHDISKEKNIRWFKTQKFYQECYERIADDSHQAFNVVTDVVKKASRRYVPAGITLGSTYLPLYCFSLVIERQGRITSEQSKIIKIYFENMSFPFTQNAYLSAVKTGSDIADFKQVIGISKDYVGKFWVDFFRALYKSGTQKDLQDVIDYTSSMIIRFSILGNPDSTISRDICSNFIECVNYQIDQVREISFDEIDWLGVIPIPDRLSEMKIFYESLIDESNITDDISKEELLPLLELLIMNCICDVVLLTQQSESVKLQMMNEAVALSGINTDVTPEEYIQHIANNTELGMFYKHMFSSLSPLGAIWEVILIMGAKTNRIDETIAITNNLLSILLQIENYLDDKYNLLGSESISKDYMLHIVDQLAAKCS